MLSALGWSMGGFFVRMVTCLFFHMCSTATVYIHICKYIYMCILSYIKPKPANSMVRVWEHRLVRGLDQVERIRMCISISVVLVVLLLMIDPFGAFLLDRKTRSFSLCFSGCSDLDVTIWTVGFGPNKINRPMFSWACVLGLLN